MSIKLIALDLDGTTLKKNHISVSRRNRLAISSALANGILVVPATGRFFRGIPLTIKKIPGMRYAITANGACITDMSSDTILYSDPIPNLTALQILEVLQTHSVAAEVYCGGCAYSERGSVPPFIRRRFLLRFISLFQHRKKVRHLAAFVQACGVDIDKIEIFCWDTEAQGAIEGELRRFDVAATTSGLRSIEITNADASKGSALRHLCEELQIPAEEVMAVGDNLNDSEMLDWAGIAVAVGNADAAIIARADVVVPSCDEDGVAVAIERLVLGLRTGI